MPYMRAARTTSAATAVQAVWSSRRRARSSSLRSAGRGGAAPRPPTTSTRSSSPPPAQSRAEKALVGLGLLEQADAAREPSEDGAVFLSVGLIERADHPSASLFRRSEAAWETPDPDKLPL